MYELRAEILVEMKRDLAVRARAQAMPALFELAPHAFVIVELAIDDDPGGLVLVRDRLIAGLKIDDAEARVSEAGLPMRRDPGSLAVRSTVMERAHGACESIRRNGRTLGKHRDNSTHRASPEDAPASNVGVGPADLIQQPDGWISP